HDDPPVGLDLDVVGDVEPGPGEAERDELLPVAAEGGVELAGSRVAGEREVGARPAGGHDLAVALEGPAVDGVVEAGGSSKETGQHQAVTVERGVPGAGGRVTGQREVVVGVRS